MLHALASLLLAFALVHQFVAALAVRPFSPFAAQHHLHAARRVQCPCALRLYQYRHRHAVSDNPVPDNPVDVLVVHELHWPHPATSHMATAPPLRLVHEHSVFNLSARSAARSDAVFHHFPELYIPTAARFVIALRASQARPAAVDMTRYLLRMRPLSRSLADCPAKLRPYNFVYPSLTSAPPALLRAPRPSTPLPQIEPRVVGGTFGSPDLTRHMVVIYSPAGPYCSGALLSARWGITAAHCGMNTTFTVGVQTTQARVDGVRLGVRRVFTHPLYTKDARPWDYDVTVFEMDQDAPLDAMFMLINNDESRPKVGAFARVAGYGYKSEGNEMPDVVPGRLRQVDLPVVGGEVCREAYKGIRMISTTRQVCMGYMDKGGCDTCQGDSGAPLFRYTGGGELLLMGITSFGIGCARPDYPGVYLRTASIMTWLRNTPAKFSEFGDFGPTGTAPAFVSTGSPS